MIFLVRHGQTEFNLVRRHHGHIDSPLTELGRAQARRAGATLTKFIDAGNTVIFSSPLGRALHTAHIISYVAAIQEAIVIDPDLMEIGMGSSEGMTEWEMAERWPGTRAGSEHVTMSFQSPDGETLDEVTERAGRALRRVICHAAESRIIVSHGIAGRVLRGRYLGLGMAEALRLDAPQDALFHLNGGDVIRISYGACLSGKGRYF
jgi:broad specificity phosphatase PhoE